MTIFDHLEAMTNNRFGLASIGVTFVAVLEHFGIIKNDGFQFGERDATGYHQELRFDGFVGV